MKKESEGHVEDGCFETFVDRMVRHDWKWLAKTGTERAYTTRRPVRKRNRRKLVKRYMIIQSEDRSK